MIKGIGVDIWSVVEMKRLIAEQAPFVEHCFTAAERDYAFSKPAPEQHLAARYAAKEAAIKALGHTNMFAPRVMEHVDYKDIEVASDPDGRPYFVFHGEFDEVVRQQGVANTFLSLSHQGDDAVAFVVFEGL